MIEFYINTGSDIDSNNYYNKVSIYQNKAILDNNNKFSNNIYVNGVTLLEDDFSEQAFGQQIITVRNSGDFYIKDYVLSNSGESVNFVGLKEIYYDVMPSGKRPFFEADTFENLISGFSGQVTNTLSGDLVFINGNKLISGIDYIENSGGYFQWIGSGYFGGGIIFSMPKNSQLVVTGQYDIYDQFFKKGANIVYVNGVRLYQEDFLEASTMLSLIETGKSSSITISPKNEDFIISF